jgi:hypothetical protein
LTTYSYISPLKKFEILGQYFGINAIKLEPTGGNRKKQKKERKKLMARGSIIHDNNQRLKDVLKILTKTSEKRNENDVMLLVPLL